MSKSLSQETRSVRDTCRICLCERVSCDDEELFQCTTPALITERVSDGKQILPLIIYCTALPKEAALEIAPRLPIFLSVSVCGNRIERR